MTRDRTPVLIGVVLVALLAGIMTIETGEVTLTRAGLPAPVLVIAAEKPELWAVPGPFLGASPFVITMLLMLLILSIRPQIALWLPQLAAG